LTSFQRRLCQMLFAERIRAREVCYDTDVYIPE